MKLSAINRSSSHGDELASATVQFPPTATVAAAPAAAVVGEEVVVVVVVVVVGPRHKSNAIVCAASAFCVAQ